MENFLGVNDYVFCYVLQSFDVSGLMLALTERHSEMPAMSKSAIPVVVPDPDNKPTT